MMILRTRRYRASAKRRPLEGGAGGAGGAGGSIVRKACKKGDWQVLNRRVWE